MTVGRFTIHSRLGGGGMGEVYLAEDTKLRRPVALKRMAPRLRTDEHYRHRFIKEAERASSLNDQHIASIYDVLEDRGETFVVMEYVEGVTLRERLKQPLPWKEFLPVAIDCAEALVTAHEKGIAHRDIKPENIMLTPKGGAKILDFGVARRLPRPDQPTDSLPTDPDQISGTLAYMAPEVLLGKGSDERADLFSMGVVFYEALAGHHPFLAGTFIATSDRILNAPAAPLRQSHPELPEALDQILARLMAKDPAGRYTHAAEVVADLRTLESGKVPKWHSPWFRPSRLARPKVLVPVLGMALAALLLVVLLPFLRQYVTGRRTTAVVPPNKYMAVLPFTVLAGDRETAAFSKGLAETVTARLGRVAEQHGLEVVSAAEVRAQHVQTLEQARREFAVNLVLEGSLQRSAGELRVTYAIVDTQTRRQLRAGTVTASAADVFAVEDQVVEGILENLEIVLAPQELRAQETRGTTQPAAYDYYLQGRGYLQGYQKAENIERAIAAFDRALELDPADALARASLGEAYWRKYQAGKENALVAKSRQACSEALKSNPSFAEPHLCMANLLNETGEYERAASEFQEALHAEPDRDDAYRGLASAYEGLGQPEKAEATYKRAIAMRPQHWAGYYTLGNFYLMHSRPADAAGMFEHVVTLVPESFAGYNSLCWADVMQGLYAEAEKMCQRSISIHPIAASYSNLATAYYFHRKYSQAAETYEQALRVNERDSIVWGNLGDAYSWIPHEKARARKAYQQAIFLARERLQVNPRDARTLGYLAWYQATIGETPAALSTARRALRIAPHDSELLFNVALVYNLIGDPRQTVAWLEKAQAAGYSPTLLRDTPNFDSLRPNPRFQRLLEKK